MTQEENFHITIYLWNVSLGEILTICDVITPYEGEKETKKPEDQFAMNMVVKTAPIFNLSDWIFIANILKLFLIMVMPIPAFVLHSDWKKFENNTLRVRKLSSMIAAAWYLIPKKLIIK